MSSQSIGWPFNTSSFFLLKWQIRGYLKKQTEEHGHEIEGMPDEEQSDQMIEEIFKHEDKDKDGYISHEEFSGPKHDEL